MWPKKDREREKTQKGTKEERERLERLIEAH